MALPDLCFLCFWGQSGHPKHCSTPPCLTCLSVLTLLALRPFSRCNMKYGEGVAISFLQTLGGIAILERLMVHSTYPGEGQVQTLPELVFVILSGAQSGHDCM